MALIKLRETGTLAGQSMNDFPVAAERAARAINTMAVSVAQILGMHNGVDLRWLDDEKAWHCAKVEPVVWFDRLLFGLCTEPDPGPWAFRPDRIKLTAANGTWIWVPTGQTREPVGRIDGTSGTLIEARWPD